MMLTGVSAHFCAAHRARGDKQFHGHTWQVLAWFHDDGTDALIRQSHLKAVLMRYDHVQLPDTMARGEVLARAIGVELGAVEVILSRVPEGIYAKWIAE